MSLSVSAAVAARRSVRGFTDTPVDLGVLRDILDLARRAPSGGNVQPWRVTVVHGPALAALKAAAREAAVAAGGRLKGDYPIYPEPMPEPYMARRRGVAAQLYDAMGVARGDKIARAMAMLRNFDGFGAPVVLFVCTDRVMGPPQWADLGIWLQTVMLLLTEAGLGCCAQEAWSIHGALVRRMLGLPDSDILWTGLAIGHADPAEPANGFVAERAPLDEMVRWVSEDAKAGA